MLSLEGIAHSSIDKCCLLQFLLARADSQEVMLSVLRRALRERDPLPSVGRMFDIMHGALARDALHRRAWAPSATDGGDGRGSGSGGAVLQSADEEAGAMLLGLLAEQGSFFQLHQYVQYQVVADSHATAAQLLELAPLYLPALELALDMLQRLGAAANEALLRRLLEQGRVLAACRFTRQHRLLSSPPRPLLAAARLRDDPPLFASVYRFLTQRNEVFRGSPTFLPEEQCDEFAALAA
jgi:hypothetical protein